MGYIGPEKEKLWGENELGGGGGGGGGELE